MPEQLSLVNTTSNIKYCQYIDLKKYPNDNKIMDKYKNILFINYGGIGDEILFLPAIKSIKEEYKSATITLALEARSKSIVNLTDMINNVIPVDIKAKGLSKYFNVLKFICKARRQKFDCVISSGKSPFVAVILFLTGIKERIGYCSKTDFLLTKKVQLNENQYAAKMYHSLVEPVVSHEFQNPSIEVKTDFNLDENLKKGEYIAIHPGVSKMSVKKNILKCPNLTFWVNLINGLLQKNKQVVLLGGRDDEELINQILQNENISKHNNFVNYFNKTKNIMEMAFVMKNSKNVICVDSAPFHVAVAVNSNVIGIFASTNEKKLAPNSNNVTIVTNEIPCRPCLWHERSENCKESKCLDIDFNKILDKII